MKPKLNTLKPRLSSHQPKARINWGNGCGGRPWRRNRDEALLRDLFTCQHCHRVFNPSMLEADHIINRAQGGSDDLSNLQTLCKPCHKIKTQKESQAGGVKKFEFSN
ncbi:HNH endonuclease [Moraxella catarrhalis]|uniref:HNH endonuclease n=1 Tax=Moraxella catarrhalis TaxID=480 RepID=UPI00128B5C93|nr:HNH endonuclease signature motif containing protein [Moraxella catarrhalis]MPX19093.1 HNH endonuclease [Moraxella catarrhalis]